VSGYRPLLPEVCGLLANHDGRLTFGQLAGALGVPADEVRRQVQAYADLDREEALELAVGRRDLVVEPADASDPDPQPSDDDVVELVVPAEDILGIELFDATVLGPLYQAADQMLAEEPGNGALSDAVELLRSRFLPGVRRLRHYRSRYAAGLRRAIEERRRVRIVYSRAWNPGVTDRVIEPYELNYSARGAEVDAGPLDDNGQIRTFLVNRIRELEVLDETFERPADALALTIAAREPTPVTGYVEHRSRWAVELWSERLDVGRTDQTGLTFTAHLLPPVEWRCALMRIAAGAGLDLDDEDLHDEGAVLAARLLDHHGLRPRRPENWSPSGTPATGNSGT
jgi:proteasome accessory factor C